jgi:hypothetical protein
MNLQGVAGPQQSWQGAEAFARELSAYRATKGEMEAERALTACILLLKSLQDRPCGGGDVVFHMINGRVGSHVTLRYVYKVLEPTPLEEVLAWVLPERGVLTLEISEQAVQGRVTLCSYVAIPPQ